MCTRKHASWYTRVHVTVEAILCLLERGDVAVVTVIALMELMVYDGIQ